MIQFIRYQILEFHYFYLVATICFFNSIRFWGGGEKLHLELAVGCKALGHHVVIACNKNGILWQRAQEAGLECVDVRVTKFSFLNTFHINKISNTLASIQANAIIFTASQDAKTGGAAAKKAGINKIVYLRGLAARVKNSYFNRRLFTKTLTHIIANSEETKSLLLQKMQHVKGIPNIPVVYHGINIADTQSRNKHPFIAQHGNGIILGNAGRLTAQKAQKDLIEVAIKLRDLQINFTLFIAGEGEERTSLENAIKLHQLQDQVFLMGFVDDIPAFMQSIDIFVLSSHWEGFGYVIVEAMAHELPVVAYDISSNPEIIADNETGLLVPCGNTDAFALAIKQFAEDQDLCKKYGIAGRKRVIEKFEFSTQLKQLLAVIEIN